VSKSYGDDSCEKKEARTIGTAIQIESDGFGSDGVDGATDCVARDAANARGAGATRRGNRRNASPARRGAAASAKEPVSAFTTAKSFRV